MDDWTQHILFPLMRWVHVVGTTLIVGGTLFFEFVVPIAIEDLKDEQQYAVFGKARWVFRRVVWLAAGLLLLSGAASIVRLWDTYRLLPRVSMWWAVGHVILGVVSVGIALVLTSRRRPPDHQVGWMRFNLVLLLVGIFAANVAAHVRSVHEREALLERERQRGYPTLSPPPSDEAAAEPATQPATQATRPAPSTRGSP